MRAVTCAKGCVVHGPWPVALANHVRVLVNPANPSLSGPQRPSFPRGGPLPPPPPPPPEGVTAVLRGWAGGLQSWLHADEADTNANFHDELLYPAQAVDGLVHLEGGSELRAALAAAAPVLETLPNGEHVRCRVGGAVLTSVDGRDGDGRGYSGLPFDAIVHTVPPFWPKPGADSAAAQAEWASMLRRCYESSFATAAGYAREAERSSGAPVSLAIATPVLGSGARGAPFAPAARILAEVAAQHFGSRSAPAHADEEHLPTALRVVVHPAGLGDEDVAVVEAALAQAASCLPRSLKRETSTMTKDF